MSDIPRIGPRIAEPVFSSLTDRLEYIITVQSVVTTHLPRPSGLHYLHFQGVELLLLLGYFPSQTAQLALQIGNFLCEGSQQKLGS